MLLYTLWDGVARCGFACHRHIGMGAMTARFLLTSWECTSWKILWKRVLSAPWRCASSATWKLPLLACFMAQGTATCCFVQAVFVVGVEAQYIPAVLKSYPMGVLRHILGYWLSTGQDVRRLLVLPAAYYLISRWGADAVCNHT